ncbi:MAG TPA: alpha/beta fold hydrolase [Gaiellaceae bacterium]|nr:alpha/beta fold hydrolase [Gaiellaceae bacterium]
MSAFRVMLLPGIVLPAEPVYGALIEALGPDVEAVAKDLEVYATPEPPQDYSLEVEIEGVLREADAHGWARFHLVGYSGGGAASLALAAARAERLASLALLEPAWAGNWDLSPAEKALWVQFDRLEGLPVEQFMSTFMRLGLKPGVPLPAPPPGDPPPWMAKRPAGIRAIQGAFKRSDIDGEALRHFDRPVYFALGALSNPDQYGEIAKRLSGVFPDFELEVFDERHHFDPPHRIEPERLANSLKKLWERAERSQPSRR